MNSIEEIKKNILKQLEIKEKEKEDKKNSAKKDYNKNRDLEVAKQCQQRYIKAKKEDGKNQVSLFLTKDNLTNVDNKIVRLLKKNKKNTRSDIINKALDFYFSSVESTNDE